MSCFIKPKYCVVESPACAPLAYKLVAVLLSNLMTVPSLPTTCVVACSAVCAVADSPKSTIAREAIE